MQASYLTKSRQLIWEGTKVNNNRTPSSPSSEWPKIREQFDFSFKHHLLHYRHQRQHQLLLQQYPYNMSYDVEAGIGTGTRRSLILLQFLEVIFALTAMMVGIGGPTELGLGWFATLIVSSPGATDTPFESFMVFERLSSDHL